MKRSELSPEVQKLLQRLPKPFANHYGVRPAPPPPYVPSIREVRDRHSAAMAALVRLATIVSEVGDPWLVSRLLVRREAVSSSAIEGTNSTLDELLAIEEDDEVGEADRRQATLQVRNYALGLEAFLPQAKEHGQNVFTVDLVQALHRTVMEGDSEYKDAPGDLREIAVWIGGSGNIAYSTYNPTPPDDVRACLQENVDYMRGDGYEALQASILTRLAIAHAHFEAVHPFRDGNGRVGRLMMPLMMAAEGHVPLYLSSYIEANKDAYYAALKAAQQKHDWQAMTGFIADAVVGTVDEMLVTRRALASLGFEWRTRRRFRSGSASLKALPLLLDYPVITIRRLSAKLSVTFAAASAAVNQLCDAGILVERTGYRRNRMFAAREVLTLVNRPFSATPAAEEDDRA